MRRPRDHRAAAGSVRLTAAEIRSVMAAQEVLLAPLAHRGAAAWCRTANAAVRTLLGGDRAVFYLPAARRANARSSAASARSIVFVRDLETPAIASDSSPVPIVPSSDEFTANEVVAYPGLVEPLLPRIPMFDRLAALGATSRDEMLGADREFYYKSTYYREYLSRIRAFDAMILSVDQASCGERSIASTALLMTFHDRERGPRFTPRHLSMLRLLYPSYRAGVEGWWQLGAHVEHFGRSLDDTGLAVALVDPNGRDVHNTPRLLQLVAEEPEGSILRTAITGVLQAPATAGNVRGGRRPLPATPLSLIRTRRHEYRLRAINLNGVAGFGDSDAAWTAVIVERLTSFAPTTVTIAAALGLTAGQTAVARLVANGRTNAHVAAALGLSPHTVRHHLENIFLRLGITTRAELAARVHALSAARER